MIIAENPRLFSIICRLVNILKILPIQFDAKSRTVNLVDTLRSTTFSCYFKTLLVILITCQCLHKKNNSPVDDTLSWICLAFLLSGLFFVHEFRRKASEIGLYVNALFQFHSIHPNTNKLTRITIRAKANILFVYGLLIGVATIPIGFTYGLHWQNPCKATIAGYWSIQECRANSHYKCNIFCHFRKCIVFLLNHWLWLMTLHAGFFAGSVLFIWSIFAIQQFIQRYQ